MARPGRSRATHPLDCHERALRLLAVRPRSRRELERRLLLAGFEADAVAEELERLTAVGLLDDDAFARQVVEHELGVRRSGRRAVVSRLIGQGVPRETIDRTLNQLDGGSEDERALELARGRAARLRALSPEQAFARLVAFLARRGYDGAVARRAARAALGVEADD